LRHRVFSPKKTADGGDDAKGNTVEKALHWLEGRNQSRPWMLWVNLQESHEALQDQEVSQENALQMMELYDDAVSRADSQLMRLLSALDSLSLVQDTLVVGVGDHGVLLGENGRWFEHGGDLYPASTQVPLVMSWPGQLVKGRVSKGPVELNDVLPTVLDLLRLPTPEQIDGISLMGTWITAHKREHARGFALDLQANALATETSAPDDVYRIASIRTADMLYVHREHPSFDDELYALENLQANRFQQVQADDFGAKITAFLQEQSAGLMDESEEGIEQSNVPLSPAAKARLRVLGYAD